ncbi:MAG: hypothetical protein RL385_650 [Pseudomonadota bacterium]|jgi:hypothetical protein
MNRVTPWLPFALSLLISACHGDTDAASGTDLAKGVVDADTPDSDAESARTDGGELSGATVASDAAAAPDTGASAEAGADPSDALFRPDHVLEVRITLAPGDWEALRSEEPDLGDTRSSCTGKVAADPYTNFHADLSIDGVSLSNVAVRKKGGLGSSSSTRPGLKVDLHEYVAEQDLFGLEHLTLNNNRQDPSLIHQCLGYGLFRAAGLPASRCSFAHVVVNGEDLGVYSNVETIKREFLRRNFADGSGNLYESGGDFLPGRVAGFQPKGNAAPPDCSALDAVVKALASPDDALVARLGALLDLPEFIRYWAMEVITDHWDGYANNQNNVYVYADPTSGKLKFIPWGIDALFTGRERSTRPSSVYACGALSWRLYDVPGTRSMYLASLRDLLATVWDVPAILAEIDRMEALVAPYADPTSAASLAKEIAKVRSFVSARAGVLLRELDAGDPVWPYAADASCRPRIGSVSASFSAPWGSLDAFDVGSGTMNGSLGSIALSASSIRASAGIGDDGKPAIRLLHPLPDGRYAGVYVVVDNLAALAPGTRAIDLGNVAAVVTIFDPATDTSSSPSLIFPGTFTLDSAGSSAGGVIAGSLQGDIMEI